MSTIRGTTVIVLKNFTHPTKLISSTHSFPHIDTIKKQRKHLMLISQGDICSIATHNRNTAMFNRLNVNKNWGINSTYEYQTPQAQNMINLPLIHA